MGTDLSLLGLFYHASLTVKLVMLVLLFASVCSWGFIFQYVRKLYEANNLANEFEFSFGSNMDLARLYTKFVSVKEKAAGMRAIFLAGFKEYNQVKKYKSEERLVLESVERAMHVALAKEQASLEKNLGFLATVQSISPYVGLFGTVWGIMHAFRQLGEVQQATLAMVAPGISEALVATAMGLIAAIPAGVAYNKFVGQIEHITTRYQIFAQEFLGVLTKRVSNNAELEH